MQIRCLCFVPDYYAVWVIVLKIFENEQANRSLRLLSSYPFFTRTFTLVNV